MARCSGCGREISGTNPICPACGVNARGESLATQTVAQATTPIADRSRPPSSHPSSPRSGREGRFAPGAILAGRYRIVSLLGKGGMGEVYRADDLTLDQQVALKFLPAETSPQAIARFRNEVRIARQVSHPNVCRVYDLGELDGVFYLSMEYVDGEDLASLLRRIGRLPSDKALEIARKLCAGLAAAHEKGVLHRDLKPSNIMLNGRGEVLLTDFGLAGIAGEIEGAEIRNGTPAYAAPEQLAGEEVSVRSDIYSLGLVLYEIFTGKMPFESDSLAGLIRARTESTPASLTSFVRDLDPAVERVVLRCLQPKPANRPPSAMAVAAALPGGDPLAAALAAGETPSPEMVAAAGEGQGLSPRVAIPLFLVLAAGFTWAFLYSGHLSALGRLSPPYSAEVLSAKSREIIQSAGYPAAPVDSTTQFDWNYGYLDYAGKHAKGGSKSPAINAGRPGPLLFRYRQSQSPLETLSIHDDWLTPGIITQNDPPPIEAGMITLTVDAQGRLLEFRAMPPEKTAAAPATPPKPDYTPLFAAAGLDLSKLTPAEPLWYFLEASDTRSAWTGVWPGSDIALRVEAAALRGKPVDFRLISPWTEPTRAPSGDDSTSQQIQSAVLIGIGIAILLSAPLLALRNIAQHRGDLHGALRLAIFMFAILLCRWITTGHFPPGTGVFGNLFLAVATASFYGFAFWILYIAIEPFVRRRWPQALISWTSGLSGHFRDPIVGRDCLIGLALAVSLSALNLFMNGDLVHGPLDVLQGFRSTAAVIFSAIPQGIRGSLVFVLMIFVLRVFLRNHWLAGAAFALVWGLFNYASNNGSIAAFVAGFIVYAIFAIVMLRFGLLATAAGIALSGILPKIQHGPAWYFTYSLLLLAIVAAFAVWALFTAMGGRLKWTSDLLE